MNFNDYQHAAARSDQFAEDETVGIAVALLGMAGETGTLLATHKKWIRDGDAYEDYRQEIAEDLGDLLWYMSDTATRLGLQLEDVVHANLRKIQERWPQADRPVGLSAPRPQTVRASIGAGPSFPPAPRYDASYADSEQTPRHLEIALAPVRTEPGRVIGVLQDGRVLGDQLSDNAPFDDGFRWHDALHLGHLAVLGWSPVVRALLGYKRKSVPLADESEDGGRAIAIEEGIAAFTFEYASRHRFLDGVESLDTDLLRTIKKLTRSLEVSTQTMREWQHAILLGFAAWRSLRTHNGGVLALDLEARSLTFRQLSTTERNAHAKRAVQVLHERRRKREQLRALRQTDTATGVEDR